MYAPSFTNKCCEVKGILLEPFEQDNYLIHLLRYMLTKHYCLYHFRKKPDEILVADDTYQHDNDMEF